MRFAWLLLLLAAGARAQSTEADLRAKLLDKPLVLRGCYEEDKLRFDAAGQPRDKTHAGSFTVAGVDLDGLILKGNKLILTGRRMGLRFITGKAERIPLQVGRFGFLKDEGITIEIAAPANKDYSAVLAQVFAFDLKDMVPAMPDEWQFWAKRKLLGEHARPDSGAQPQVRTQQNARPESEGQRQVRTNHTAGEVSRPVVQSMPEPEFSEAARKAKISGNVMVYLVVGKDGRPENVHIVQPIGMGLDEQAVKAVRNYRFTPAMKDGEPVRVEMNVQVNFQIF